MRKRKFTAIEDKAHDDEFWWPSLEEIKEFSETDVDLLDVFFFAAVTGICVVGICFAIAYYLF